MKRTLSITLDDESKMVIVDNMTEFSYIELLGMAKHLQISASITGIDAIRAGRARMEAEEAGEESEQS